MYMEELKGEWRRVGGMLHLRRKGDAVLMSTGGGGRFLYGGNVVCSFRNAQKDVNRALVVSEPDGT